VEGDGGGLRKERKTLPHPVEPGVQPEHSFVPEACLADLAGLLQGQSIQEEEPGIAWIQVVGALEKLEAGVLLAGAEERQPERGDRVRIRGVPLERGGEAHRRLRRLSGVECVEGGPKLSLRV
jgi:hypothetical protein